MIFKEVKVMYVEFEGYFEVDDGQEEVVKQLIEEVLFDLPFLIDITFKG